MKSNKLLALILAFLLAFAVIPLSLARTGPALTDVPEGYNEYDYLKCVAFLEQEDENGVKNGNKLNEFYDPNEVHSWGTFTDANGVKTDCFLFRQVGGEQHIVEIKANEFDLVGALDFSGCEALSLINSNHNRLSSVNVENCASLVTLSFMDNGVTSLDVTTNPNLVDLGTADNPITELDLSCNPLLHNLFVGGGAMRELDLSHNPQLPLERIYSVGNGAVGYMYLDLGITDVLGVFPLPFPGAELDGWYTEDGVFLDDDPEVFYVEDPWEYSVLVARFNGGQPDILPGDVDADGEVTVADALLAMRNAMGLLTLTPEQTEAADVDGDGEITVADALLIMRVSMGIISF